MIDPVAENPTAYAPEGKVWVEFRLSVDGFRRLDAALSDRMRGKDRRRIYFEMVAEKIGCGCVRVWHAPRQVVRQEVCYIGEFTNERDAVEAKLKWEGE